MKSLKIIPLVLLVLNLIGCGTAQNILQNPFYHQKDSKVVQQALKNTAPSTGTARIRLYPTINQRGYQDYLTVTIIRNGKKHSLGFHSSDRNVVSLGMPKTEFYDYAVKQHRLFGEYVVPANSPVILGIAHTKMCGEGWFHSCHTLISQRYFIPEAGKDYEIINEYHVYQIENGKSKEIESRGEFID